MIHIPVIDSNVEFLYEQRLNEFRCREMKEKLPRDIFKNFKFNSIKIFVLLYTLFI